MMGFCGFVAEQVLMGGVQKDKIVFVHMHVVLSSLEIGIGLYYIVCKTKLHTTFSCYGKMVRKLHFHKFTNAFH